MSFLLFALFIAFAWAGTWLIPSSDTEAQAVQAPYRALRGVLCLVVALFYFIAWCGR
jgi:hypothetical protein